MQYIGVMSGTSCDGVDVVLVSIKEDELTVVDTLFQAYEKDLKSQLLRMMTAQLFSARTFSEMDVILAKVYADAVLSLLKKSNTPVESIQAIGLHGQTVDHNPPINTWQLGSAAHVATLTGIDVVADFRTKDVALGGQGAPLAPAVHRVLFGTQGPIVVLNLGGIANITYITNDQFLGFDTGPANCLMDLWVEKHLKQPCDFGGQWAATGSVNHDLLDNLLDESYFHELPPKSTGRELFNDAWLNKKLKSFSALAAVDVQATLLQLTAMTVTQAIKQYTPQAQRVIVCGGGVYNSHLIDNINQLLTVDVVASNVMGIDSDYVEATLMAWLAFCHHQHKTQDLTQITGTSTPHIYGVYHSAR